MLPDKTAAAVVAVRIGKMAQAAAAAEATAGIAVAAAKNTVETAASEKM